MTHLPLRMQTPSQVMELIDQRMHPYENAHVISPGHAVNFVLAEDVHATRNVPGFDNSAMDGFVIRRSDWDSGQTTFPVKGEIPPEQSNPPELLPETAMRIMTGAPIPPNGDCIVPVELVDESGESITVRELPAKNPVRKKGEGYQASARILGKNTVIRAYEMGLMIEAGLTECTIKKPLQVGIQVTGTEIDASRNTNGPVISRLAERMPGVMAHEYPVAADDPRALNDRLHQLKRECDIIVTTGGISAGKFDYLPSLLEEAGAEPLVRKVNQKPGKPFTLFDWEGIPVCCLPGNPVSSVFCSEIYLRRIIARLTGQPFPVFEVTVADHAPLKNAGSKTLFVPGTLSLQHSKITVHAEAAMKSHLLQLYRNCNCYVWIAPESEYSAGDTISVIPFTGEFGFR